MKFKFQSYIWPTISYLIIFNLSTYACENEQQALQEYERFSSTLGNQSVDLGNIRTYLRLAPDGCLEQLKQSPQFEGILRNLTSNHLRAVVRGSKTNLNEALVTLEELDQNNTILGDPEMSRAISQVKQFYDTRSSWCTKVDLRPKMEHMPIRSQTDSRWCFAYTAADIISFKTGENVSALDTAMRNNQMLTDLERMNHVKERMPEIKDAMASLSFQEFRNQMGQLSRDISTVPSPSSRGGGRVTTAMLAVNKAGGYCLESEVNSDNFKNDVTLNQLVDLSRSINETYQSMRITDHELANQHVIEAFCDNSAAPLREAFSETLVGDILTILKNDPSIDLFNEMVKRQCSKRKMFSLNSIDSYDHQTSGFGLSYGINQALDAGVPAAFGYYSGFFTGQLGRTQPHSSSIVGRRWNADTQQCQYLIRNSWGNDCNKYVSPFSLQKNCEDGNVWVNEDVIEYHGLEVEVFK